MLKNLKAWLYRSKFLREIVYLSSSSRSLHVSDHLAAFIGANRKHWKDRPATNTKEVILVEGFLASYGINYLLRTGMVAKALEETSGYTPAVLFDDYASGYFQFEEAYRTFNIKRFIYTRNKFLLRAWHGMTGFFVALYYFIIIRKGEQLIPLRYRSIHIGDLIYDDIIKNIPKDYTINSVSARHFRFFFEAFYSFGMYESLLKRQPVKYLVATHCVYIKYGVLARLAMYHGAEVFETNDVHLVHYKEFDKKNNKSTPSYLGGINEWIQAQLNTLDFTPDKEEWVDKFLYNRFKGNFDQLDINLAFKDKKTYDTEALKKQLNISNDRPLVFLLAHALSDAPHLSKIMIFKDYYDWMAKTMDVAKNIRDVNWIFKPHPAAKLFGEEGFLESMVASYHCDHFYITPPDFSTESVKGLAKAILTTQGTAGLEFSCFGIPVIITGRPLYAGFGFTLEPDSAQAYYELLRSIHTLKVPGEESVRMAKKVYYLYEQFSLVANNLIHMDTLKKVWNFEEGVDKAESYYEVAANLDVHDPKGQRLYKKVKEFAVGRKDPELWPA
jgi:hypothetical protein